MQLVGIVVSNARFHLSQNKTNQSTVTNVFQNISHKAEEARVAEDLVAEVAVEVVLTEGHEKCIRLHVEIVAKNVRFHLSQNKTSQSIAASVFKTIKETKKILVCWTR